MWRLYNIDEKYSTKYFCNAKVAGLSDFFPSKFLAVRYITAVITTVVSYIFLGKGDQPQAS